MTDLLTTKEAAEMLGIKPQTLRKWACNDKQPYPLVGRSDRNNGLLFRRDDVEAVVDAREKT